MLYLLSAIVWWLLASLRGAGSALLVLMASNMVPQYHVVRRDEADNVSHAPPPPRLPPPDWAVPFGRSTETFQRPCTTNAQQWPYCDTSLPDTDRLAWLLENLTPSEKLSLVANNWASAVPRLGLPAYNWWNEGLHGVAFSCCPDIWYSSTSFPQVCTTGASFNKTLFGDIGNAIGQEAVEHFYRLADVPGLTYWSPNINLFRDPRWGRGQEVPGEDPFLNAQFAAAIIPAMQYGQNNRDGKPRIAAACKHFAAYSLESGRFSFDAQVDQVDLEESYLPAFQQCVESGVLGFMCSYNAINGVPSCANTQLLTDKLRKEWGFDGYITGDCGAVNGIYSGHHFVNSTKEGIGAAFQAGVDIDCGGEVENYQAALDEGFLSIQDVDRALTNLFSIQFRLGYFNPFPATDKTKGWEQQQEHRLEDQVHMHNELALEAARQGIVLLKNGFASAPPSDRPLPLSPSKHPTIALLGPNADATFTMLGNYFGVPPFIISPKQGLEDLGVDVASYYQGCNITAPSLADNIVDMCHAAATADVTVLIMGNDGSVENEDRDRTSLLFPGQGQVQLIELASSCAKSKGKPVVLIIMSGGPIDLSDYKQDENIDAILYVGYPGQAGGTAIAEILYGYTNPSGRLSTTIYNQHFAEQVDIRDMRMRPSGAFPGRTYRYYTGDAVYPFGFGMSYSTFETRLVSSDNNDANDSIRMDIEVCNLGPLDGSYSLLLFHSGPNAGIDGNPRQSLAAFDKIFLPVGAKQVVSFEVDTFGRVMRGKAGLHRFWLASDTEPQNANTLLQEVFWMPK